ncbi:hypothetical protein P3X46_027166 [Hevea brasiliensis]|uniref:BURP domain-containing protein n=1 Tax=Hevea brasiliensis TaxID=3981 RepID=A0ABQ9KYZ4_HEVBR|nr:hypothetical protein P3X46_027166 [Hevea brasiliensis]
MEQSHLLTTFALLFCIIFLKGSNASLPAKLYWQSMLPNAPLPKALQDLLQPDAGNRSAFSGVDVVAEPGTNSGRRATYGVGHWEENKKFEQKEIFNTTTIYFLQDGLHPDKKMKLTFTKSTNGSNFLPRKIADTLPFSSNKLPEILNYFAIEPTSKEAQILKHTIAECEAPSIRGEHKYCATSLESLIDFVVAKYGKKVQVLSNEAEQEKKEQGYTILKGVKMMDDNQIACHEEIYPYAVYMVPLMGGDGSKAKAIVVCHLNTTAWNPEHFAFQVLKVKPGPPVCHFLDSDTNVWVPN